MTTLAQTGSNSLETTNLRRLRSRIYHILNRGEIRPQDISNSLYIQDVSGVDELFFSSQQLTENQRLFNYWELSGNILTPVNDRDVYIDVLDSSFINVNEITGQTLDFGSGVITTLVSDDIEADRIYSTDLCSNDIRVRNAITFDDKLVNSSGLYKKNNRLQFDSNVLQFRSENFWEGSDPLQMKSAVDLNIQDKVIKGTNRLELKGRDTAEVSGSGQKTLQALVTGTFTDGVLYLQDNPVGFAYNPSNDQQYLLANVNGNTKNISNVNEIATSFITANDGLITDLSATNFEADDIETIDLTASNNITTDTLNVNSGGTLSVTDLTTSGNLISNGSFTSNGTFQGDSGGIQSYVRGQAEARVNEEYFTRSIQSITNLITGNITSVNELVPATVSGNQGYLRLPFIEIDSGGYIYVDGKVYAKEFVTIPAGDDFFDFLQSTGESLLKAGSGIVSGVSGAGAAVLIGGSSAIVAVGGSLLANAGSIDEKDLDSSDLTEDLGRSTNNNDYLDKPDRGSDSNLSLFNVYGVNPRTSKLAVQGIQMSEGSLSTNTIQYNTLFGGADTTGLRTLAHETALSNIHETFLSITLQDYTDFSSVALRFDYDDAAGTPGSNGLVSKSKVNCLYAERQNQNPSNALKLNFNGDEYATLAEVDSRVAVNKALIDDISLVTLSNATNISDISLVSLANASNITDLSLVSLANASNIIDISNLVFDISQITLSNDSSISTNTADIADISAVTLENAQAIEDLSSTALNVDKYFTLSGGVATSVIGITDYVFDVSCEAVSVPRLTFNQTTISGSGLETDGTDLFFNGEIVGVSGDIENDKYFTLNGTTAQTTQKVYDFSDASLNFIPDINIQCSGTQLIKSNPLDGSPTALDLFLGGGIVKITNFNTTSYSFGSSTANFDNFLFCNDGLQVDGEFSAGVSGATDQVKFDPTQTGQSAKLIYQAKGANVSRFNIIDPTGTETLSMGIQDSGNAYEAFFNTDNEMKFFASKSIFNNNVEREDGTNVYIALQNGAQITAFRNVNSPWFCGVGAFGAGGNGNWAIGSGILGFDLSANGNLTIAGSLTQNSDRRIKTNIQELNDSECLTYVKSIEPVSYNYIDKDKEQSRIIGFIAQDVRNVLGDDATEIGEGLIPYIQAEVETREDIVYFNQEHNLTQGQRICMLISDFDMSNKSIYVDSIINAKTIKINETLTNKTAFFKGYYVDDFHRIKKERLIPILWSATQQLVKQNDTLKLKLAEKEADLHEIQTRLTRIETLLLRNGIK